MRLRHMAMWTIGIGLACGGPVEAPEPPVEVEDVERTAAEEPAPPAAPAIARPAGPLVPLAVGHKWSYEITERKGAGIRIFGFATEKPTTYTLATHTFEITGEQDGRYSAALTRAPVGDELPSTTQMSLWIEDGQVMMDAGKGARPAIEASVPPDPVSSEQVRCVAHMLGGAAGSCAPLWGGPLGIEPGLTDGVVGGNTKEGAEVAQFLVGIATVGIFIPGNKSTVQRAHLTDFEPAAGTESEFAVRPDPLLATFERDAKGSNPGPRLVKAIEKHGGSAESVAAALTLVPWQNTLGAAESALPVLDPKARYPVSRVAIQRSDRSLQTLARLRPLLDATIPADQAVGLLALFEDAEERETADALIDGKSKLLLTVVGSVDGPFDSDVLEAVESALNDNTVYPDDVAAIARMCTFDDCKVKAGTTLVAKLDEGDRAAVVAELIGALSFDDGKLELIRTHIDLLKALPRNERQQIADKVTFEKEQAQALLGL